MKKTEQKHQLLEACGHAEADSVLLNVLLQAMANSADSQPGMDATIVRSINRAEREMHEIKTKYEEEQ